MRRGSWCETWREDELFRRDMRGAWFAGYVFGMLSALAVVLATGGCWAGTAQCPEPGPTYTIKQGKESHSCLAGLRIPERPDFLSCSDVEADSYWYCRSIRLDSYGDALHAWATSAVARCTP